MRYEPTEAALMECKAFLATVQERYDALRRCVLGEEK